MSTFENDRAVQALEKMQKSVNNDAREIFFALWAKYVGVDWDGLSFGDRELIMMRLNYIWHRALDKGGYE